MVNFRQVYYSLGWKVKEKNLRNKCSLLRFNTGGGGGIILGEMSRFLFEKSNNCKGDSYSTFEFISKIDI